MPLDAPSLRTPPSLAPGDYTVTVTYINYPDYDYVHYDPFAMPAGVWEGLITTPPIRLTVKPLEPTELAGLIDGLRSETTDDVALRLLAVSGRDGVTALVRHFATSPISRIGFEILVALQRADQLPLRELIAAIENLPLSQRTSILGSPQFERLVRDRATCELLEFFVSQLGSFTGPLPRAIDALFSAQASSCGSVRTQLRDAIVTPSNSRYTRRHAAALVGTIQHPDDRQLLIDILDRGVAGVPLPSPRDGDPIRAGAVAGLSRFKGRDVVDALARALADERRNIYIGPELARALFDVGGTDVVPPLIGALSSSSANLVIQAIIWLRELRATAAVPELIHLLRHSNPTIRSYAAGAIRQLGDVSVRDSMLKATNDVDGNVQANALFYLVEYGDSSLRDLFIAGLQSRTQSVREAAINGILRFGIEDDFPRLRRLFDLPRPDVLGYLPAALSSLTFTRRSYPSDSDPKNWDRWYEQHRRSTRVEWAREALRRTDRESRMWPFDASPQREALEYLAARHDPQFIPDFQSVVLTTRFAARVEAARALATFDKRVAGRLLIREFSSRFQGACDAANRALNGLTGLNRTVNCREPQARVAAAASWETAVNAL